MKELIEFMEQEKSVSINLEDYSKISLIDEVFENKFKEFLKDSRANRILGLKLIDHFQDKEFFAGNLAYGYDYVENVEPEAESRRITGPRHVSILANILKQDQMFSVGISNLGFSQIDTRKAEGIDWNDRIPKLVIEEKDGYTWNLVEEGRFMMSADREIIILEDSFYVLKNVITEEFKQEINTLVNHFKEFVETESKKIFVEHGIYLKILQEIFPGKIKIKTLK